MSTKRTWRQVDGVLLFDKPLTLSSNAALQKVRRLFQAEKAGHTGTLDPLATGLLPVCFGEAAKFSSGLLDAEKAYLARVKLGATSSTGDTEGEIMPTGAPMPDEAAVRAVLRQFCGDIEQIPPMHSALKHQGKPLYEYIRKGETIAREPRRVTIHELELESFSGDVMEISVRVSKGTYIRTLAEDIGHTLGCGAHLLALRRTATAWFSIGDAYTLEQLEAMSAEQRDACLLPVDSLLPEMPVLDLDAGEVRRLAQGQRIRLQCGMPDGKVNLRGPLGFVGVGRLQNGLVMPERLIAAVARGAAAAPA
ncbi:MAG TPA: tRNA pseudouridine(55) synthase TruB [Gallionellaceae bacterium]|nr:tRNA pseudouridine(55) synthase TruB [Gallionellaceae bacterium]